MASQRRVGWSIYRPFKRSVGMSHIRFDADGKVILHQDFWDSTGGLFEHVPGLGWMLRSVKSRL